MLPLFPPFTWVHTDRLPRMITTLLPALCAEETPATVGFSEQKVNNKVLVFIFLLLESTIY